MVGATNDSTPLQLRAIPYQEFPTHLPHSQLAIPNLGDFPGLDRSKPKPNITISIEVPP
jgi:hypothetical protein